MILTKNNLTEANVDKAFNTVGGFSFSNEPEVRDAVSNKVKNIVSELQAKKLSVSLEEFHANLPKYREMLKNGYGN